MRRLGTARTGNARAQTAPRPGTVLLNRLRAPGPESVGPDSTERGASAVFIAILMVALLGFGAIAVDVGALYAEKAQLQSGADAAALAVAGECAWGSTCTTGAQQELADRMANRNANDGESSAALSINAAAGNVTAATGTVQNGAGSMSLFFASVFGIYDATVRTTATAAWGAPRKGPVIFPLAISNCDFTPGSYYPQLIKAADPSATCSKGAGGHIIPGGFGWLTQDPGQCGALVDTTAAQVASRTGNAAVEGCDSLLNSWISRINSGDDVIILVPVFDAAGATATSGWYHLRGFAAFQVMGWKFTGSGSPLVFHNTGNSPSSINCTGDCRGIIGQFIRYVSAAEGYELGGTDLGAKTVRLIN